MQIYLGCVNRKFIKIYLTCVLANHKSKLLYTIQLYNPTYHIKTIAIQKHKLITYRLNL
jgi:hypothetical protein